MQCDTRKWCNFKFKNSDLQKGGIQCKETSKNLSECMTQVANREVMRKEQVLEGRKKGID